MGKIIAITGATEGIGKATVEGLKDYADEFIIIARNTDKANNLIEETGINAAVFKADLLDLDSVRNTTKRISDSYEKIDILINNAGGMFPKKLLTREGAEYTFAMNHLGHFVLTIPLIDLLKKGDGKIINLSSEAHRMAKLDLDNYNMDGKWQSFRAYCNAKLCNVLFTNELNRRFHDEGISSFAIHPGMVGTNFGSGLGKIGNVIYKIAKPLMLTPEKGASTTLYVATTEGLYSDDDNFFEKRRKSRATLPKDHINMEEQLWDISLRLTS